MKKLLNVAALLLCVMACTMFTSCSSDDEEEVREIYGTFKGSMTFKYQSEPGSEFETINTSGTLEITKAGDNTMSVSIKSDDNKFEMKSEKLPALDVKGNRDYRYSMPYETDFGPAGMIISSSDFDNVKYEETGYFEDGSQFSITFNGKRVK